MITTLRKYLDASDDASPQTLRVAELFLQGIQLHACQLDDMDYGRFHADLAALLNSLNKKTSNGDVILATGAALQAMSDYNKLLGRSIRGQMAELQNIVKMLGETLRTMLGGSERQVGRLQSIETQIQGASQISDLRALKGRLEDCLGDLREAVKSERESAARVSRALESGVEQKPAALTQEETPLLDACTGLPGPAAAETALKKALAENKTCFAGVYVVNRIVVVNARYGHTAGDHILVRFSQNIAQRLSPGDALFRWYGPAFLVIMNRSGPQDAVRAEVARIASGHKEEEIQVGTRSILLSISSNTVVLALHEYHLWDSLREKLLALPGITAT